MYIAGRYVRNVPLNGEKVVKYALGYNNIQLFYSPHKKITGIASNNIKCNVFFKLQTQVK